jgi:hypothetical protein
VLHQHFLNRFFRQVGIDSLPAEGIETLEAADKRWVLAFLRFNRFPDGGRQFGNAVGEVVYGLLPFLNVRGLVVEEGIDDRGERFWFRDALIKNARPALVNNDPFGGLKDNVVARVAFVEFALDFFGQVVFLVLRFLIAVGQVVKVNESAIHSNRSSRTLYQVFGDECQLWLGLPAALREKVAESATDRAFVVEVELAVLVKGFVILLHGGVGWLQV